MKDQSSRSTEKHLSSINHKLDRKISFNKKPCYFLGIISLIEFFIRMRHLCIENSAIILVYIFIELIIRITVSGLLFETIGLAIAYVLSDSVTTTYYYSANRTVKGV